MTQDIKNALKTLSRGGTILYPTDTIWGIGCDATNPEAVKKIFEIKQRADSKAMLVLLDDADFLHNYVTQVPEVAYQLIAVADRPTTIIYPKANNLAPNLPNSDGSIGIRITSEHFTHELIRRLGKPIVSTSANISGQPAPKHFGQISQEIKQAVDYVVGFRQRERVPASPSSIIKLGVKGEVQVLRP